METKELLNRCIDWFSDIEDLAGRLTSGNVSHLGSTIKGKAVRCKEFLQKHINDR